MQTPGMVQHPPIHVDDLYDHIEMLKANDNEKFSSEYESIEPGQQFTWDNRYEIYSRFSLPMSFGQAGEGGYTKILCF